MRAWLLQLLREKMRRLMVKEARLEAKGHRLMLEAMNQPTASLPTDLRFLVLTAQRALTRKRKALTRKLLQLLGSPTR